MFLRNSGSWLEQYVTWLVSFSRKTIPLLPHTSLLTFSEYKLVLSNQRKMHTRKFLEMLSSLVDGFLLLFFFEGVRFNFQDEFFSIIKQLSIFLSLTADASLNWNTYQ